MLLLFFHDDGSPPPPPPIVLPPWAGLNCPLPTQGPVPCPSTIDQHLNNIRKILPRGIAWLSVFDPTSVMYGYFRSIAAIYQWANDQFCQALREMFCATRLWLSDDYLVEFGLPNPCAPNLDPCNILPVDSATCEDLVTFAAGVGWTLSCLTLYQNSSLCATSGCASTGSGKSPATLSIGVLDSGIGAFALSASSGLAVSGITVSGCSNSGPGTIPALHCIIDSFLPAHISYTLQVIS